MKYEFSKPFYWEKISKKLQEKILYHHHCGCFTPEEAKEQKLRLVTGCEGLLEEGNRICFYLLVNEGTGKIEKARFQAFGAPSLIGAAELTCELVENLHYEQAQKIGSGLIDRSGRDQRTVSSFPEEEHFAINLVLFALSHALFTCTDLPFPETTEEFPSSISLPNWKEFSHEQKLAYIEEVLEREIRPFVTRDGGDVLLVDLKDNEVLISYLGACATCHAAGGGTLSYIQRILQTFIDPDLFVTVQLPSFPESFFFES